MAAPSHAAPPPRAPSGLARLLPAPALLALCLAVMASACSATATTTGTPEAAADAAESGSATAGAEGTLAVSVARATEQPIARFIGVTGTLTAEEQADVAAEIAGRVVATPVERGTRVGAGAELVRIAEAEVGAQAQEADANARQIEARLGIAGGTAFQIDRVPEVASARAAAELARADFERAEMLVEKRLLSQADFDRSRTQAEATARQLDVTRNAAEQQYQALLAARARAAIAQKALADTVVRAPFSGVVEQRLVSVGDYVTRGTRVASVMRTNPLRVELTVPEQFIAEVSAGRAVTLTVDAYRGETFTGIVRYVSPALKTDTRSLVVEAVVENPGDRLKPGFFATARIEQASPDRALLVPAAAVRVVAGSPRVYVVSGDRVEERIVTTGQTVGEAIEIATGLMAGEAVATTSVAQLVDGARVSIQQD
ncbi:MAG: efflux RND transporter periplasmic adaptor subunit [Acidobacteria bacterium]|nr:efflux RND transporter periplasmic adaptor subunit [Acidobacteriota bacterium]